jgi:hypothetical protein
MFSINSFQLSSFIWRKMDRVKAKFNQLPLLEMQDYLNLKATNTHNTTKATFKSIMGIVAYLKLSEIT